MSYIGTRYRGAQKHANKNVLDIDSIQGAIEAGLRVLVPPVEDPHVVLAGRTDLGVHALSAAAHVNLTNTNGTDYHPDAVKYILNRFLKQCCHDIKILSVLPVTDEFHARHSAIRRTYIYRFMFSKDRKDDVLPIQELYRTFLIKPTKERPFFDIDKFKGGVKLFEGTHDFQTFCNSDSHIGSRGFIRTLDKIELKEAGPLMSLDPVSKNFEYYELTLQSRAFLYNQVRRIVGTLIALGQGKVDTDDIITMLQVPSHNTWMAIGRGMSSAGPDGLYLFDIEYESFDKFIREVEVEEPEDFKKQELPWGKTIF